MKQPTRKKSLTLTPSRLSHNIIADSDVSNVGYEISLTLIQARMKAGLSQEELAKRLGTTRSVIVRLESGQCLPNSRTIALLAKATGTFLCEKLDP